MCLSGKVFLENMFKISYVYVDFFALRLPKLVFCQGYACPDSCAHIFATSKGCERQV